VVIDSLLVVIDCCRASGVLFSVVFSHHNFGQMYRSSPVLTLFLVINFDVHRKITTAKNTSEITA
jgi:hypothetical protein